MDGGRVVSRGSFGGGWLGGGVVPGGGVGFGGGVVWSLFSRLTGSLSFQQCGGITCSPVSARQKAPFKYSSK